MTNRATSLGKIPITPGFSNCEQLELFQIAIDAINEDLLVTPKLQLGCIGIFGWVYTLAAAHAITLKTSPNTNAANIAAGTDADVAELIPLPFTVFQGIVKGIWVPLIVLPLSKSLIIRSDTAIPGMLMYLGKFSHLSFGG